MTTPINYLYIDDENSNVIAPLIERLEVGGDREISITHRQVFSLISDVISYLKENKFHGLIIDQQLNAVSEDGNKADYFGSTLAQQLRTEMAIGNIPYFPLVLLSNEKVIVESFFPDDSAKNLFDFVIIKNDLSIPEKCFRSNRVLNSLNYAYNQARELRKDVGYDLNSEEIMNLFDCDEEIYRSLDSRFIDYISSKASDPHSLVGAIYSSLIQSAGILVSESMLLTKLGISSDSPEWPEIRKLLTAYLYLGPFHDLKERWWFQGIENWWYELCPEYVLQSLSCEERVSVLKDKLQIDGLNHISISYPDGDQSPNLWVNCVLTGVPLDPFDALRVRDSDAKPWEQPKYLDLRAYLNDPSQPPKYFLHADDKDKVRKLLVRLKPNVNE